MQIVSDAYKAYMSQPVRPPFHMEITVHTDTPIVYTDNEIFEFEEKKTAHPIGAELPTIEVSFKVDNIAGDYNADSPSGLYEQLIKGVKVTYRYGLEIPNVMPYGYPADEGETEEPIYGADPLNPYGFSPSSTIEWMDGGEVYTTGEISYDKTSATIEAVDALSFLEETADVAYGTITRKQCAEFIIDATEYPEDLLGAKKISIDDILETWNTNVVSDKNAKQVLQSLAHASGVQMYIDRSGYLHLDKIPITTGAVDYHVTLGDQDEDGEFTKGKTPRKVVVKVNTKNVVPEVSETINPKGEDILVENDFVQTTLQAEAVLPWVKRYLGMRNTAEIEYAGDPSLDILDIVLLDTEYSENIPATIVESTIRFDGSITGSLVLRYDSALADNTTVKITGAENFIYSGETPSPASVTLVCETDVTAPSYEWSYFNDSSSGWQVISGATTANLTILADSPYIVGSNPTSFRVVVRGDEGTKGTTVRIRRVQETVTQGHTYLGKLTALPSAYDAGDYFLVSTAFGTYGLGDVVQWDGDSWEVTNNPALIVMVYQDALTLSMPLENTSAVNQYIRSIQTKQILLSTDTPIMFFYEDDTPYDGGQVATITATRKNVIAGINWYINGDLVPDYDEDTIMVYDTDMSGSEITVTAVSVEYASVNAVIKIAKKKDRKLDASNLGLITNGDPTPKVGKDGAPLVAGDYFMWGNPTTSTPDERKKGAVYIYQTNDTWLEDTDGTKTMSMFAQFVELPNDTDSAVMGNAIIKKLVAIDAFIKNLKAQNLSAGLGDGTAGSGFRFRAMQDQYMGEGNNPVFDVMFGDRVVFKTEPNTGKVYLGTQFWYDPADGAIHSTNDKIVIDASGSLKATFAEIVGTIRTGPNAPTNTRLGARDQSGVTVGPIFSGSGLNDMSIATEGTVDMLGLVKVESVNHRDLTTTVPVTSASNWTIRTDSWDLSCKCFDSSVNRIIGAGSGGIGYSDDSGTTWIRVNSTSVNWQDIAVHPASGVAVAVGYTGSGGSGAGRIAYSTNHGTSWTIIAPSGTYEFYSLAVNPSGRFVTSAKGAYNSDGIYYSDNGSSWTRASAYPLIYRINSITCNSNGIFVAVNDLYNGYSAGNSSIWYSSNGASWSSVSISSYLSMSVSSSIHSSLFILTTSNANGTSKFTYYTSTNGSSWTARQASSNMVYGNGFAYNPSTGYWVGVGSGTSGGYVCYSSNGTSFAEYAISTAVGGRRPVSDWSTGRFIISAYNSNYLALTAVQPFYDKIRWSANNGSSWAATGVVIPSNGLVSLNGYGVVVSFGNRAGHTINDQWTFTQEEMHGLVIWDVFGSEYLKATDGTLSVRDRINLGTPSLSANGYTLLPNGMMMQWVSLSLEADNQGLNVTFPIAFSTACVFATVVSNWHTNTSNGWDYVRNISTTGCTCVTQAGNPRLLAIGY